MQFGFPEIGTAVIMIVLIAFSILKVKKTRNPMIKEYLKNLENLETKFPPAEIDGEDRRFSEKSAANKQKLADADNFDAVMFGRLGKATENIEGALDKIGIAGKIRDTTDAWGISAGLDNTYPIAQINYDGRKIFFYYQIFNSSTSKVRASFYYSVIKLKNKKNIAGVINPRGIELSTVGSLDRNLNLQKLNSDISTYTNFSRISDFDATFSSTISDLPQETKQKLLQYQEAIIKISINQEGIILFSHKWLSDEQTVLELLNLLSELDEIYQ